MSLLRFLTCGSVDDGKSTLIGRLLFDSKALFDDQLAAVEAASRRWGTQGERTDLALLVDGLAAEREQGITIDVAYRFFATPQRKFIVADTPGHEQYTRNMVTGASTADAAVILVDAQSGIATQTRRHSHLVALLGIRHVVLAVNKMDRVGWSRERFEAIEAAYAAFAASIGLAGVMAIPLSALEGDNVCLRGGAADWYHGPTLLAWLEAIEVDESRQQRGPLRLPVQWVNRPNADFRGYSGLLCGGLLRPGERVRLLPSGRESTVTRIASADGDLEQAVAGQSVTVVLADEVDISRGDMLVAATQPATVADQFEATLVWMDDEPLLPGRTYLLKLATQQASAQVTALKYQIDVDSGEHVAVRQLGLNAIAVCNLAVDREVVFDPYEENRDTGGFILIDRFSNRTVAAGMIHYALRRAHNIHRQHVDVDRAARTALMGQKGCVVWFTGLSGAGKSTIANQVEQALHAEGRFTYLLDGDNVRHGLCRDLGFTDADRVENIRRVGEVARLMVDAGLIVLTAFISPFRAEREMVRALFAEGEFIEVFVDTRLEIAEQRDPKGLYRKARSGALKNFTGIDSPYEPPETAELHLDTTTLSAEQAAVRVLALLSERRESDR